MFDLMRGVIEKEELIMTLRIRATSLTATVKRKRRTVSPVFCGEGEKEMGSA